MDSYASQDSRWEAYQFSDPYSANAFVCGLKEVDVVCRPSCDHYQKVANKEDVIFLESVHQALGAGYRPCTHCDPATPKPAADIELIKSTIDSINYSIGFSAPLSELKKRAFSTPSVNTSDGHLNERQVTRNESEHAKLVELACRHIAAAAAESLSKQDDEHGNKKKRRGGVLGFKELAAKSKLSPWHFHRVFKSVTGLTPKSYGDQCWKHMKSRERPSLKHQRSHFRSNSDITSNYNKSKRVKREDSVAPTAPVTHNNTSLEPSHQSSVSIDLTPIIPSSEPLSLNSNSLDINVAPMRHHSLDLGSVGLDSFDLNAPILPNFVPVSQFSGASGVVSPTPLSSQMHNAMGFQLQTQDPMSTMQDIPEFSTPSMELTASNTSSNRDGSVSIELYENMAGSEWSKMGSVTDPTGASRLLTPPSSVFDPMSDTGVYNTFASNSPLDDDVFFNMNNNNNNQSDSYALLSSSDIQDPGFLFATMDQNDLIFDGDKTNNLVSTPYSSTNVNLLI